MIKNPITISLCMIVKNEESTIARCLDSIKGIADEIIIIDTGSTDNTKKILEQYTTCVYDFPWIDDFSAARNFAFSKATKDYIFWLDADDIVTLENKQALKRLKHTMKQDIDAISMKYCLTFDEQGNPAHYIKRYRLVKRERNFQWHGVVHEYLAVYGNLMDTEINIIHKKDKPYTNRNLKIYEKLMANGKELDARDTYYYANECKDHKEYEKAIIWYNKFLTGEQGWDEDNIQACLKLSECQLQLKQDKQAIITCFQSFLYDNPRAEICCQLGEIFLNLQEYTKSIHWYQTALLADKPTNSPIVNEACYTWLPHIKLCIGYSYIKEYKKAEYHNEQASIYLPNHTSIAHNKAYFREILSK